MAGSQEERLILLKRKYQSVMRVIDEQQVRLEHVHLQDGKLFIAGIAPSVEAKNKVWDKIKAVDPLYSDLIADILIAGARMKTAGATAGGGQQEFETYTVRPGDTLSKISEQFYGDSSQGERILQANRDKLSDPSQIQPGQTLMIPS